MAPSSPVFISAGTVRRSGMDFVADQLFDGRKIRALTIVDNYSRQCIAIHVGQSLKAGDVVVVMNHLKSVDLAVPQRIQVDNGSEFISKALDLWAYDNGVTLDFSRPGKPTDNPFIESFNGSFRDECLNAHRSGGPVVFIVGRCP
ncbi:DDE-type integrase/transposase/recombinase [Spirosoma sp. HMF4905]|uniref:DDE-type integrase/transposase/recombinase n=1 Tax=Spirosoma arboris TaxID=2682092 RepID=A0A7K1SRP4_9BACT|nr:DDE-type integrase/transposase/recombinase [Spirosoma arboris]